MKALIKGVLTGLGYQVSGTRYTPRQLLDPGNLLTVEFDHAICRRMFEYSEAFRFIQVGVFDGIMADPLHKYISRFGWRGVMVEPQPKAVASLRAVYKDGGPVTVMQAALDGAPGKRTLYMVGSGDAPSWAGGLASFDRDVILKHADLLPSLEHMLHEEEVACVTFDEVLARLGSEEVDLLQIDTEGADAYILSLFPFQRVRPAIVHFEVKHLSLADREACLSRLLAHGYRVAPSGTEDMLAVLSV